MRSYIRRQITAYPLISFLVINYAISWGFLYPAFRMIIAAKGAFPPLAIVGLLGGYGPSIAAVIVVAVTDGGLAVRTTLLRKLLLWRVSLGWYAYVLILPVCVYALAVLVQVRPPVDVVAGLKSIPIAWMLALPFGPMGEELGWRGFLLPRLLERYSVVRATVMLGLAWTVWHAAAFTFPGAAIPSVLPVTAATVAVYAGQLIAEALIFTYVFLKTRGSVLVAIFLHMSINASTNIVEGFLPSLAHADDLRRRAYYISLVLMALWALITYLVDVPSPLTPPPRHPEQRTMKPIPT